MNNNVIKPYEDWVIRNKKFIIDWVKQNDRVRLDDIRNAFNNFERATSNKSKLKAFDGIKNSLHTHEGVAFSDLIKEKYEPAKKYAQELATLNGDGTIESIPRNTDNDKLNKSLKLYDLFNEMSSVLSTIPAKQKDYSYVELDKAFQDNYDYNEMTALAEKYNYDWSDKEDRKEFIKALSEIEQERLKAGAYTPHDAAGMLTQLAYPVTLEHARKTDKFSPYAFISDLATQMAMAEGAGLGKAAAGKAGEAVGGLVSAPAMTEYGQMMVNDKPISDAAADAGTGVILNSVAPGMILGAASNFYRPGNTVNSSAKALANKYANEYRKMINLQHEQPYIKVQKPSQELYEATKLKYINAKAKQLMSKNPELTPKDALIQAGTGTNLKEAEEAAKVTVQQNDNINKALAEARKSTGVYKKNLFGKETELTPEQVNKSEYPIAHITPEMRETEKVLYRWNKPKGTEVAKYNLAKKKANNETITPDDLVAAGYYENPLHMVYRKIRNNTEGLNSLALNLGAANRLADRKIGMFNRMVNLPWNYGESEPEIDWNDPKVKTYVNAYKRYKSDMDYYQKPKKPEGMKDETAEKIEKYLDTINIRDIFGE